MKINKNTIGFVILIVLLLAAGTVSLRLFMRERSAHDKLNINTFPFVVGDWKGRDLGISQKDYDILETKNIISREYENPDGQKLFLLIIYSETNRSVFHPPEVCMMGGGMALVDKQVETINTDNLSFSTNKLFLEKDGRKEITLYSYKAGHIYTSNFYLQQAYLAFKQIFDIQTPGATIRVAMPTNGKEGETLATLKDFLAKTVKIVDSIS